MGQITVPAKADRLDDVFVFIDSAIREAGFTGKQQNSIKIAVEEIFVNITSYAYPSDEGDVTVCVSFNQDALSIEFRDNGLPYNPLARTDPDTSLSADEREPGGLGILIVKKMMDDVCYEYRDGQNILRLTKNA